MRNEILLRPGGRNSLAGFPPPIRVSGWSAPRFTFTPTGQSEGIVSANDAGFAGDKVAVSYGTGRSHGAMEDWLRCASVARWIGNGLSESKVGFTFSAPGQTGRIEDLASCQGFAQPCDMAAGGHTIHVGTDQQGLCTDDLHARYVTVTCVGAVSHKADTPRPATVFGLGQNAPNPFNPSTEISFVVPEGGANLSLRVYDITGRLVRTLVDGHEAAGTRSVTWHGRDDQGRPVASGITPPCRAGNAPRTTRPRRRRRRARRTP
ncbi:MAG: hypothetical protein IH621_01110 [Krumholzibacteria bacterium]|nr:hypothetical protein [Candidatus Krumholzibacteria bacterium]